METTNSTEGTVANASETLYPKFANNATKTKSQSNNINKNTQGNNSSSRSQNRRNNYYTYNKMFKGESTAMNGAGFEIHVEQLPKGLFQDTLDALKIYSSTIHKLDIDSLNVLFIDLTEPIVVTPTEPIEQEIINAKGTTTVISLTNFQETVYRERNNWIKDTKRLKVSLTLLYNVVWGQCSKLMQNKLIAVENISDIQLK